MSNKLFDGSDGSEDDYNLTTNKAYAKSYNKIRQKELLKKFKDRGDAVSDSETSSDSDSSSDGEVQDVKFDQEFFRTLASLKSRDPAIYDKNTKFFDIQSGDDYEDKGGDDGNNEDKNNDKDDKTSTDFQKQIKKIKKDKKSKVITLKDYERKIILENNGKFEDDSENEGNVTRSASPTAIEAERSLKAEFKKVLNEDVDSEEEGFGGIFKKRVKSKEQKEQEEADFAKWLAGKQEEDKIEEEDKKKLEPLKNYWQNNNLPQSEKFLRDYILNKGYAKSNPSDIPTYEEIIGDAAPLSEDEVELKKQDEFEHKYNFRFEEPDAEFITRYPRTIQQSVRRVDDKRKQKRLEIKERKQKEKQQKMKEIEMLKELKRKEIEEKIQKLKMVTGNDELGFKDEELEGDFDPEEHDKRMKEIFNEDYYQVNEGDEKPECPSDIDELKTEDWDNYIPENNDDDYIQDDYEPHCEDDDFNMDCDYDPAAAKEQLQKELIENSKSRRNRKGRKSRFKQMIETKKPAFKPEDEKTYAEYIDEYYKLDCEDIIGDIPCRFKYVETIPNDFGLTIEDILLAKNKELNQWASLKKAVQIRPDHVEKKEQRLYKMKAKNEELKRKIFKSLYGEGSDEESEDDQKPSNKGALNTEASDNINNKNEDNSMTEKETKQKRKRKLQKSKSERDQGTNKSPKVIALPQNTEENNAESGSKTETPAYIDNKCEDGFEKEPNKQNRKLQQIASETNMAHDKNPNEDSNEVPKKRNKVEDKLTGETLDTLTSTSVPSNTNVINKKKKNKKNKAEDSTMPTPQSNSMKKINSNETKNKRKKQNQLPPLLKKKKFGSINAGVKLKHKVNRNRGNSKGPNKSNDTNISDERLKAYGINPKKFYKKKKYREGNINTHK